MELHRKRHGRRFDHEERKLVQLWSYWPRLTLSLLAGEKWRPDWRTQEQNMLKGVWTLHECFYSSLQAEILGSFQLLLALGFICSLHLFHFFAEFMD